MNVYLCVEIASREMTFKKYLQNILNKNNVNCIVGFSDDLIDSLISGKLDSGIIIVKSIQRYILLKLILLRLTGNRVVYMEEEAWVPLNDVDIIKRRFPKSTYKLCSSVLCPNNYYNDLIKSLSFTKNNIFNVGSNRMSTKKEFNVKTFKKVLFLGSYGALDSEKKFLDIFTNELNLFDKLCLKKLYKYFFRQYLKDKSKLFDLMKSMSKDSNLNIYYRPHPSESNIYVDNISLEPNNIPISESCKKYDLIIHSGSTSTFEIKSGKVLCYSDSNTNDIHQNSKFHGPIAHNIEDIYKICKSNIRCLYNDLNFVNKFDEILFVSTIEEINLSQFNPFKKIINIIYSVYIKTISPFRRNMFSLHQKRKRIDEF